MPVLAKLSLLVHYCSLCPNNLSRTDSFLFRFTVYRPARPPLTQDTNGRGRDSRRSLLSLFTGDVGRWAADLHSRRRCTVDDDTSVLDSACGLLKVGGESSEEGYRQDNRRLYKSYVRLVSDVYYWSFFDTVSPVSSFTRDTLSSRTSLGGGFTPVVIVTGVLSSGWRRVGCAVSRGPWEWSTVHVVLFLYLYTIEP